MTDHSYDWDDVETELMMKAGDLVFDALRHAAARRHDVNDTDPLRAGNVLLPQMQARMEGWLRARLYHYTYVKRTTIDELAELELPRDPEAETP